MSKSFEQKRRALGRLQDWSNLRLVANSVERNDKELRSLVANGIVRARRVASRHSSTGTTTLIYVPDVLEVLKAQRSGEPVMSLVSRGVAALSCEDLDGFEIETMLSHTGDVGADGGFNAMTDLFPGETSHNEVPPSAEDMLTKRIEALEVGFSSLLGYFGGAYKGATLDDSDIESLMKAAANLVASKSVKLSTVHEWMQQLRSLSSEHLQATTISGFLSRCSPYGTGCIKSSRASRTKN